MVSVYSQKDKLNFYKSNSSNSRFLDEVIEILRPIRKFANASREVKKVIQETLNVLKPYDEKGILAELEPSE